MHSRAGVLVYALTLATAASTLLPGFAIAALQPVSQTVIQPGNQIAACPQLPPLRFGAADATTHGAVSELQRFLSSAVASSSPLSVTGFFGPLTQMRVLAFQEQAGIPPSGSVDATTSAAVMSFCTGAASSTAMTSVPITPGVTFDQGSSFTSLKADPTITGSAIDTQGLLRFEVQPMDVGGAEAALYQDGALAVSDGSWSVHVPSLPNGAYLVSLYEGITLLGQASMEIGLVSFPTIIPDFSLPPFDVADGRLLRFGIHAEPSGPVSIEQLSFSVATTSADLSAASLYAYSDSAYSTPLASSTAGLLNADPIDPSAGYFAIVPDAPIMIPAGETYYFELDADVVPSDMPYSIVTTLLSDPPSDMATLQALAQFSSGDNFIWSPDTFDISSTTESDWATGALVDGLADANIEETRGNQPEELPPTCSISADQSAITPPSTVTVSWSTTDAEYVTWSDGTRGLTEGSRTFTVTSAPRDFTLTVTGKYGIGECTAIVNADAGATLPVAPVIAPPATTTAATSTPDSFAASVLSGPAPLAVTFKGTINNSLSCAASTYTFAYGDNSTSTVAVAAKLCKAQSFTLSHSYAKNGTYAAKLYRGAFPATKTSIPVLVQTQLITATTTAKKVVSAPYEPLSNIAGALESVTSWYPRAIEQFFQSLFARW